jgi:hypothetical protein
MIEYRYGRFAPKHRPMDGRWKFNDPWPETKACKAHEKQKSYAVEAIKDGTTICWLDVGMSAITVYFLDVEPLYNIHYWFSRWSEEDPYPKKGRIFLRQISEFKQLKEGDTQQEFKISTFFNEDGSVEIRKDNFINHTRETGHTRVDPTDLWEDWPEFGNYESIIRFERNVKKITLT